MIKIQDVDEQLAKNFLLQLGYSGVEYEPRGRDTPPDFLVDKRIAVEVRRLKQNFVSKGGKHEGLDKNGDVSGMN